MMHKSETVEKNSSSVIGPPDRLNTVGRPVSIADQFKSLL